MNFFEGFLHGLSLVEDEVMAEHHDYQKEPKLKFFHFKNITTSLPIQGFKAVRLLLRDRGKTLGKDVSIESGIINQNSDERRKESTRHARKDQGE